MDAPSTAAELTPQQIAEAQAAKDRELLTALQDAKKSGATAAILPPEAAERLARMVSSSPFRPNRAMRRLALRHANRTWVPPLNPRARRERRALARAGIFVRNHPIEA